MELIENEMVGLTLLIIKKCELEKKLKKTIKCLIRKCFKCMGMVSIEEQLKEINDQIKLLSTPKLKRFSSI